MHGIPVAVYGCTGHAHCTYCGIGCINHQAVQQGDIVWHAGAFNTEYELAFNEVMVGEQFRLSRELSDELGVPRSTVLSLRDVPGTTRALIPLLARHNISALTVGVNNHAPDPAMPSPGRWADSASNTSIMFMQTGPGVGYPAREANHGGLCRKVCVTAPKLAHAMCWAFRPDNSGPPDSVDEVLSYFAVARKTFPSATVEASTYDRFVQQLATVEPELPTVTGEVGDTWVTSQSADPRKWTFYREASRAYSECLAAGLCDPDNDPRVSGFLRCLIKLPEHTGGPDSFPQEGNWTNDEFHKDISTGQPAFVTANKAYLEQREIASVLGLQFLADHPLARNITERLKALQPAVPDVSKLVPVPRHEWSTPFTVQTDAGNVTLGMDGESGALTTVMMAGVDWAGPHNPIGQYIYRTFNDSDYRDQGGFCCYGLPGRQQSANPNQTTTKPTVTGMWLDKVSSPTSLTAQLTMPTLQHRQYGAPRDLWVSAKVDMDGTVSLDLQVFNKTKTRLGEASFFRFEPVQRTGCRWMMDKLGSMIDPLETVTNGSLHSHGVRDGVAYLNETTRKAVFSIDSLDAFVADPATATEPATNFLMPLEPLTGPVVGFDMQLHQNAFSTNMPQFSLDGSFRFRFRLRADSSSQTLVGTIPAVTRVRRTGTDDAARISPLDPIDDWHYPQEESTEMHALLESGLKVMKLHVDSNATGTLTLRVANGTSATMHLPGDTAFGWVLRGFLSSNDSLTSGSPLAVLEFEADRWGIVVFLTSHGRLSPSSLSGGWGFRKGVGEPSQLRQPQLDPRLNTSSYYTTALADPTDALTRAMESASAFGETTFATAAAYLAPTHDYSITGNSHAHTKFSVAQDGKVWLANFSIYSPIDKGPNTTGGKEPGVLLFNPQDHVWWPAGGKFSEYKTSLLGRYTRAVTLAAWDMEASRGFSLTAVPNTQRGIATQPYDVAELLVRIIEYTKTSADTPRYFSIQGCVTVGSPVDKAAVNGTSGDQLCTNPLQCKPAVRCHDPAHTASAELHDAGGLFHANLLAHANDWTSLFEDNRSLQVELQYDLSEGTRLIDMARATIVSAMSTFLGLRPNYGDGANYWSVAAADRGALPLESFSLSHALLLWGLESEAAARVEYYLFHYVRSSNGLTPFNSSGTNTSKGIPGSIDLKHWRDACAFADSFADLGRWLDLWVEVARQKEATNDAKWISRTWVQVKLMAQYLHGLRVNATKNVGISKGLIYGPAEFDECMYQQHWFSISAWAWRGLLQLQRFLVDTAVLSEGSFAAALQDECNRFKQDLDAARDASIVRDAAGRIFFIPPYPAVNFTPYPAMPFSNRGTPQQDYGGGAAYANFRYFSEMLAAQWMGPEVDVALSEFRESHFGTLSSMTRFRTHLDDMPAAGYAYSDVATNRTRSFNSLLFGHIANYQSRGTYNAPEQLGFNIGADGFRELLSPGTGEADIDTCVPSTTLSAMMVRWMLVFEDRDVDTIWLLKAAPRRFYPGGNSSSTGSVAGNFLAAHRAATRFGWVSFSVDSHGDNHSGIVSETAQVPLQIEANVSLALHGRGFVSGSEGHLRVVVRLRDPTGERTLTSAAITHASSDRGRVAVIEVDMVGECVVVAVPRQAANVQTSNASFGIVARFE